MRDLVLIALLSTGALTALRLPWVGALFWTWVSLMSPHVEFGWAAANYPFGLLIAACTLTGLLFSKERQNPLVAAPMGALLVFSLWITITLPFSIHFNDSWPLWVRSMKIFFMLFVTVALIDDRRKLDAFLWVCALSVGFYGFKGGLFTLATGGNFRVWGPGGFIQGNNELAAALIMTVPIIRYLQLQVQRRWMHHGMSLWMVLCMVAAIGTHSRGALLGLAAMTFFLWTKSEKKVLFGGLVVLAVVVALPMMPSHWWDRMHTIKTYDEDASAMGRLHAWHTAFNIANHRLFGGGFMVSTAEVFARYAPSDAGHLAAHSIYFQVLGEHGWIGLFAFLGVGFSGWISARRTVALAGTDPQLQWAKQLAHMTQVSLIGFAVGGAFLSLAYFDGPYNFIAAMAVAQHLVARHVAQRVPQAQQAAQRSPSPAAGTGLLRGVPWAGGPRR